MNGHGLIFFSFPKDKVWDKQIWVKVVMYNNKEAQLN